MDSFKYLRSKRVADGSFKEGNTEIIKLQEN